MKNKNMNQLLLMLATTVVVWFVLLFDFKVEVSNGKIKHTFKYIGLVWVVLDHYSIWKYNSSDEPMKWIEYKKEQINNPTP